MIYSTMDWNYKFFYENDNPYSVNMLMGMLYSVLITEVIPNKC